MAAKDQVRLSEGQRAELLSERQDHPGDEQRVTGRAPLSQLERLADLRDRGALTGEEFDERKHELLAAH